MKEVRVLVNSIHIECVVEALVVRRFDSVDTLYVYQYIGHSKVKWIALLRKCASRVASSKEVVKEASAGYFHECRFESYLWREED